MAQKKTLGKISLNQEALLLLSEMKNLMRVKDYSPKICENYLCEMPSLAKLSPPRPVIKIPVEQRILEKYGTDITKCPCCEEEILLPNNLIFGL